MKKNSQKILALKYRPQIFSELIGQDIMVQTIINSIESDKIPNAYLLTGIRGVGKTTSARIIAKALNCKNGINNLCKENQCEHCDSISNSNHLDVLEMDAASKTGIDDVRELIDSSRYNPTSAKYKIFIIDEVHMLSKQAFNGLLKTLEEPPPHLKFIFATTEVKKIPITIISRCQRFDLKRVNINLLFENLKKIAQIEEGNITDKALKLIAKSSEGSVRDSLSLLDRALVSQNIENKKIDDIFIQKMLGIADRSHIIELLELIINGDTKLTLERLKKIINEGVDPKSVFNNCLELIHFMISKKNLGVPDSDALISENELNKIEIISKNISNSTLFIFWQFTLKAIEELNIVSNPALSLEMYAIRLIHLKDLPKYEEVVNLVKDSEKNLDQITDEDQSISLKKNQNQEKKLVSTDQIKNILQTKPDMSLNDTNLSIKNEENENIQSFDQLINISSKYKEIELKYDLERNVNLVSFSDGKIDISFNENLGKNFVRNLTDNLLKWTGKRWVISLTKNKGEKTYYEQKITNKKNLINNEKNSLVNKQFMEAFSDAELVEIKEED